MVGFKMRSKISFRILIFIPLIFSISCLAQNYTKKKFIKTDWLSDNMNDNFFKSDTIRLIKRSIVANNWQSKEYDEFELDLFNHGYYVELGFRRSNKMKFNLRELNYRTIMYIEDWKWIYNKKDNTISIYNNHNKYLFSFIPISEKQVEIKSKFNNQKITTTELTVLKIKSTP